MKSTLNNTSAGFLALIAVVAASITVSNALQGQAVSPDIWNTDSREEIEIPADTHMHMFFAQGEAMPIERGAGIQGTGEWRVYRFDGTEPPYDEKNYFLSPAMRQRYSGTYGLTTFEPGTLYYIRTDADMVFNRQSGLRLQARCGNGIVEDGEFCDSVAGCSDSCKAKTGYSCVPEENACEPLIPIFGGGNDGSGGGDGGSSASSSEQECPACAAPPPGCEGTGTGPCGCGPYLNSDGSICEGRYEQQCGNNICEEGEANSPGGCGPDASPECLGPPARQGSCPQDCEVSCPDIYCPAPPEGCEYDGSGMDLDENGCHTGCGEVVCPNNACGNGKVEHGEACDLGTQCADGKLCSDEDDCSDGSNCFVRGGFGCSDNCFAVEDDWFCEDRGTATDERPYAPGNPQTSCRSCSDTDPDNHLNRRGITLNKWSEGDSQVYPDFCNGNTLTQWSCEDDIGLPSDDLQQDDCGNGCSDGACVLRKPDQPECGNGILEMNADDSTRETCDRGYNKNGILCTIDSGDSNCAWCSSTCDIRVLWGTCGNGIIDEGEECDDGNHRGGDGCTAGLPENGGCTVQSGWSCRDANARPYDNNKPQSVCSAVSACDPDERLETLFAGAQTLGEILAVPKSFVDRFQAGQSDASDDVNCDEVVDGVPEGGEEPSGDFALVVHYASQLILR